MTAPLKLCQQLSMLSIYEDGVSTTLSLPFLNHVLIDYVLEASRVIWAYRPLWSIVLILFEPGTPSSL